MIRVILTRSGLKSRGACGDGLALYDAIVALSDSDRVDVEWTPLAAVWLAGSYPNFSRWLSDSRMIPIANLRGAHLYRADLRYANLRDADLRYANLSDADLRGANLSDADLRDAWRSDDPPVGWRIVGGRLARDVAS